MLGIAKNFIVFNYFCFLLDGWKYVWLGFSCSFFCKSLNFIRSLKNDLVVKFMGKRRKNISKHILIGQAYKVIEDLNWKYQFIPFFENFCCAVLGKKWTFQRRRILLKWRTNRLHSVKVVSWDKSISIIIPFLITETINISWRLKKLYVGYVIVDS
jgi:hypothetical protein